MPRGNKKQALLLKRARSQSIAIHSIENRILWRNMPALRAIRARTRRGRGR